MPLILPLFSFLLILLSVSKLINNTEAPWRTSFLIASLLWGLVVAISTEIFSLFHLITFDSIFWMWLLLAIILCLSHIFYFKNLNFPPIKFEIALNEKLWASFIAFNLFVIGAIAITAPPNNWDSMTYHMSRVMHWIQNQSLGNYATHDARQLTLSTWAETSIMHFQLLSGSDRYANMVQWFSMFGSVIGVSLIAKEFWNNKKCQIFASLIAVTIPMGILQGSSTQNDYVVSFWLVCFAYFLIRLLKQHSNVYIYMVGIALGLSLLTKTTAYIYSFGFFVGFFFIYWKKYRLRSVKIIFMIMTIAVCINAGHYARNIELCGHLVSEKEMIELNRNHEFSPQAVLSNIIRQMSLHLVLSHRTFDSAVVNTIGKIHNFVGIDVSDPKTTYEDTVFSLGGYSLHEDYAGNPLHLILAIVCILLFLIRKELRSTYFVKEHLFSIGIGFLIFCIMFKWHPCSSRYQLPLFVLVSPLIGLVLARYINSIVTILVCGALFFTSLIWVFYNQTRPILRKQNIFSVSRKSQYFSATPGYKSSYIGATREIISLGCSEVGLLLREFSWEYTLWPFLMQSELAEVTIRHVGVSNITSRYSESGFIPCVIISNTHDPNEPLIVEGNQYLHYRKFRLLNVFVKDGYLRK